MPLQYIPLSSGCPCYSAKDIQRYKGIYTILSSAVDCASFHAEPLAPRAEQDSAVSECSCVQQQCKDQPTIAASGGLCCALCFLMRLSTHICQAVTLDCLVKLLQAITIAASATARADFSLGSHGIDGSPGCDDALHVQGLMKQKLTSNLPISLGEGQLEGCASASPQRLLIAGVTAACSASHFALTMQITQGCHVPAAPKMTLKGPDLHYKSAHAESFCSGHTANAECGCSAMASGMSMCWKLRLSPGSR